MMDIGPPDSKRPRIDSGSGSGSGSGPGPGPGSGAPSGPWSNSPRSRQSIQLPHPGHPPPFDRPPYSRPDSQPHTPHTAHPSPHVQDDRRHHEPPDYPAVQHRDPHPRHLSGPAHPYHPPPYAVSREASMKRDPSDENLPLQQHQQQHHHRPPSTGIGPEHNQHPDDHRRYVMSGYEPMGPGHGPYRTATYPPPPQTPAPQTPMASQPYEAMPMYGHAPPTPRDAYNPGPPPYAGNNANPNKRKPQRAAQACDSCRSLKAKCDEMKPCTSCREKGIPCHFREPPPKQQDKTQEVLLDAIQSMSSQFGDFVKKQEERQEKLESEVREMRQWFTNMGQSITKPSNGSVLLKKEDTREEPSFSGMPVQPLLQSQPQPEAPSVRAKSPNPSTPAAETMQPLDNSEGEDDQGDPVPPGPPAMPINHTTGAARLLLVGPIHEMTRTVKIFKGNNTRTDTFPLLYEEKRGLLRLYGRGEGLDLARGYDNDPMTDHNVEQTPSDVHSEASSPATEEWGQVGGLTPPNDVSVARGEINANGMPDFRRETVIELVDVYMTSLNRMHPLITERSKNYLVNSFLKSIAASQPQHRQLHVVNHQGSTPDSPGSKRKRSRDGSQEYAEPSYFYRDTLKPGHPPRTISTAMVLAMLALGAICKHKEKIRDVCLDREDAARRNSPLLKNGSHPMSPLQGSPTMSVQSPDLPSPQDAGGDRLHPPHSRRTSMDGVTSAGVGGISGNRPKNLDLIPGLQYFAMATDIIGNQLSGNTLQHVHTNILASLYHGQLGRVIESWGFLCNASRALRVIIRKRLGRWEKLMAKDLGEREPVPAKDNPDLFAFWTLLQLESDILAELPLEQTGILRYEAKVPWPNMVQAEKDGFSRFVLDSYSAQLFLRKHLNQLHTMFYSPESDTIPDPQIHRNQIPKNIDIMAETLEGWRNTVPEPFRWREGDPPSDNILVARLRAKYYGARVITYRYFVLKILENSAEMSSHQGEKITQEFRSEVEVPDINKNATNMSQISATVLNYAKNCIEALIESTVAFDRAVDDITKDRLIVTNIWGTAHAQWGNVLTLQAVYRNTVLKKLVNKDRLSSLLKRTLKFLSVASQPSSALQMDIIILNHAGEMNGLISRSKAEFLGGGSFSSSNSGGDVIMTGH
ncbi:hypothetical protein PVAG01_03305 [Phlyctema vagabunda]|uniref:Zn(2)-C6 fungal-type domain-containing protein n=1 Tax=Phlyctema vagabunda TaxID=108571 RepID=A0ABR4PL06_9HELO